MDNLHVTTKENNSFLASNIPNGTEEFIKETVPEDLVNETAIQATASLCLIIMVVGIPGNLLVIASVAFNRQLKTSPNILVLILSVGDVLLQSTIMPVHTYTYITGREPPQYICIPVAFLTSWFSSLSALSTGSIAFYRYYAVVLKNRFHRLTEKKVLIATCCFAAILPSSQLSLILTNSWATLGYDVDRRCCSFLDVTFYANICFGIILILPLAAMTYCYIHICLLTRKSRSRVMAHNQTGGWVGNPVGDKETHMSLMLAMVFFVYLITIAPLVVLKIFVQVGFAVHVFISRVCLSIKWMSTAINPFVYGLVNKQYRNAYRKLGKNVKSLMCACLDNNAVRQI